MSSFTPLINQSNELLERKHYHIETIDYLLVSPADQKLFHISNKQILKNYSVSTSRFGLGNLMDSLKTPVGLHCIEEKIGKVLEVFLGSASLKRSNPEATTPVEFPNSIKLFSNQ